MRRTVATLLVVATAPLMAVPVGASDAPPAGPAPLPAAPAVVQAPDAPAAPEIVQAPPAVPAPAVVAPATPVLPAPAVARPAVRSPRAKVLNQAGLSDAAYSARLQAELCRARQIFCGLDNSGRYPGR